jgi:hypothetical protein
VSRTSSFVAAALAGAVVLLTPVLASAALATDNLDNLRAELEDRRDNDFGGTLDKAAKKQQKSVLKSLAAMDKTSTTAGSDVKILAKVVKTLSKGYPGAFAVPSTDQTLSNLAWNSAGEFRADGMARTLELYYVVPKLGSAALAKKVEAVKNKALVELFESWLEAETVFEASALLAKVTALLDGADKNAAKDKEAGDYLLAGSTSGNPVVTTDPFAEYKPSTGELQIFGSYTNPKSGVVSTVAVTVEPTDGTGTYTSGITGFYTVSSTRYDIVDGTATLTIDTLDTEGSVIAGTFSFSAFNAGNGVTLTFDRGEFRLTTIYLQ